MEIDSEVTFVYKQQTTDVCKYQIPETHMYSVQGVISYENFSPTCSLDHVPLLLGAARQIHLQVGANAES